MYYLLENR